MQNNIINNLSDMQKDALKEIGNIGAGNAATAFSQFLDSKIEMNVPSVEVVAVTDIPEVTGNIEQKIVAVLLKVRGEAPGEILFLLDEQSVERILNVILDKKIDLQVLEEIEISAIKEIGNILAGSYLSSLNQVTNFNLRQSEAAFAYDMAGAILSSAMISLETMSDHTLLIETHFLSGKYKLEGYFFFIPEPGSLKKILKMLGFDVE